MPDSNGGGNSLPIQNAYPLDVSKRLTATTIHFIYRLTKKPTAKLFICITFLLLQGNVIIAIKTITVTGIQKLRVVFSPLRDENWSTFLCLERPTTAYLCSGCCGSESDMSLLEDALGGRS